MFEFKGAIQNSNQVPLTLVIHARQTFLHTKHKHKTTLQNAQNAQSFEMERSQEDKTAHQPKSRHLRSRKDGIPAPVLKILLQDIELAGGFTKNSTRKPRFRLSQVINAKRDLYAPNEKRRRQVDNKVQRVCVV